MGEPCLESPPPIPWTHGTELECQVGHSAPGLECYHLLLTFSYFSKHMQSIYQAIKNTLWGVAIRKCSCQNKKSCLCEAGDSVFRGEWIALVFDVMFTHYLTNLSAILELPALRSKNSTLSGEHSNRAVWVRAADLQCCPDSIPLRGCERRNTALPLHHLLSKWRERCQWERRPVWFLLWHLGSRCAPRDCLPAAVSCYRYWNSTAEGFQKAVSSFVSPRLPTPDKVSVKENRAVYQVSGITCQPSIWVFTNIPQQQVLYSEGVYLYLNKTIKAIINC